MPNTAMVPRAPGRQPRARTASVGTVGAAQINSEAAGDAGGAGPSSVDQAQADDAALAQVLLIERMRVKEQKAYSAAIIRLFSKVEKMAANFPLCSIVLATNSGYRHVSKMDLVGNRLKALEQKVGGQQLKLGLGELFHDLFDPAEEHRLAAATRFLRSQRSQKADPMEVLELLRNSGFVTEERFPDAQQLLASTFGMGGSKAGAAGAPAGVQQPAEVLRAPLFASAAEAEASLPLADDGKSYGCPRTGRQRVWGRFGNAGDLCVCCNKPSNFMPTAAPSCAGIEGPEHPGLPDGMVEDGLAGAAAGEQGPVLCCACFYSCHHHAATKHCIACCVSFLCSPQPPGACWHQH